MGKALGSRARQDRSNGCIGRGASLKPSKALAYLLGVNLAGFAQYLTPQRRRIGVLGCLRIARERRARGDIRQERRFMCESEMPDNAPHVTGDILKQSVEVDGHNALAMRIDRLALAQSLGKPACRSKLAFRVLVERGHVGDAISLQPPEPLRPMPAQIR